MDYMGSKYTMEATPHACLISRPYHRIASISSCFSSSSSSFLPLYHDSVDPEIPVGQQLLIGVISMIVL